MKLSNRRMPVQRRPPMPKLPPFALADSSSASHNRPYYLLLFFTLFTAPLIASHLHLLTLPFFWDEHGQFIPTALDLLRTGAWVAHSTIPNVHPPGVEMYLVLWYKVFGFSIPVTRFAMLLLAGAGLLFTFLLAIELSRGTDGAPAFLPPLFLLASPLFYTQSMMAQLDMPAMVFTLLSLLLFLQERNVGAALTCVALVLVKETGVIVPAIFGGIFLLRKDSKRALLFIPSGIALLLWLLLLHSKTGYWLGNPGFAHYNVEYALNPVRILFSLVRRVYYLFFAEFRWIGTSRPAVGCAQMPRFSHAAMADHTLPQHLYSRARIHPGRRGARALSAACSSGLLHRGQYRAESLAQVDWHRCYDSINRRLDSQPILESSLSLSVREQLRDGRFRPATASRGGLHGIDISHQDSRNRLALLRRS